MKTSIFLSILVYSLLAACRNQYYSNADFQKVQKIDAHVHINSNDGDFEDQAVKDNFVLITLNVDHSDSAAVDQQLQDALLSSKKFPGKVFYGATFYFDTAGWGTESWSKKAIAHLEKNISGGAITVKIWKNIGMTERDRNGKFIMVDDLG